MYILEISPNCLSAKFLEEKFFFFLYSRCRGLDNCLVDVLPRNQLFLLLLLVLYANEASQTARERERERASQHAIGRVLLPSALRGHYDVLFSFSF